MKIFSVWLLEQQHCGDEMIMDLAREFAEECRLYPKTVRIPMNVREFRDHMIRQHNMREDEDSALYGAFSRAVVYHALSQ